MRDWSQLALVAKHVKSCTPSSPCAVAGGLWGLQAVAGQQSGGTDNQRKCLHCGEDCLVKQQKQGEMGS